MTVQDIETRISAWKDQQMQKIHNLVNSAAWWKRDEVLDRQLQILAAQEAAQRQQLTTQQEAGDTTQAEPVVATEVPATPSADKTGSAEGSTEEAHQEVVPLVQSNEGVGNGEQGGPAQTPAVEVPEPVAPAVIAVAPVTAVAVAEPAADSSSTAV